MTLPNGSQMTPSTSDTHVVRTESQAAHRNILVVDDDLQVQDVITRALRGGGYRVEWALDGLAALAKLNELTPDLVLSEIRVPYFDGMRLAERLWLRVRPIPVILMSVTDYHSVVGQAPFIRKPLDSGELLSVVANALDQRRTN